MFDLEHYLGLVPSFNAGKPKFTAMLAAVVQPFVDAQTLLTGLPNYFDIDVAVGAQLDAVGEWVGRSRYIPIPLPDLWFSFDDPLRGFDRGIWKGPYDTGSGIARLEDETYRRLLRAVIAANDWDGTRQSATIALEDYFAAVAGTNVFVQDNGDMSAIFAVSGRIPSMLDLLLLSGGYIPLKPAAVKTTYLVTSIYDRPLFGFDVENQYVSGFDGGALGVAPEYLVDHPI